MIEQAGKRTAGSRRPTGACALASAGNATRPFCSIRCELGDPGRRLDGAFRGPGPPLALPDSPVPDAIRRDA